jgi:hypothetical protein
MSKHVVVDGSNLATEGRTAPSLKQLVEAVETYMNDHPDDVITVVVDATFGHRIDPREVPEFDAAIENNELVCPPAGAVGRGDAFVLSIAHKAGATILSNDSFQEFHGQYDWLFDEGRLVGGKPVPNVGWVFVARTPVRGPVSRRAMKDAKKGGRRPEKKPVAVRASKEALQPMPVPKTPPPGPVRLRGEAPAAVSAQPVAVGAGANGASNGASGAGPEGGRAQGKLPGKHEPINDLMPFLDFVEQHPVGTIVSGVVDAFSSHGAYVLVGPARCYVPLRHLGDPAPRSAREVVQLGQERSFVVVSFNAARRGIDIADPAFAPPIGAGAAPVALTAADAAAATQVAAGDGVDGGREGRGRRRGRGRGRGEGGARDTEARDTEARDTEARDTAPHDGEAHDAQADVVAGDERPRRGRKKAAPALADAADAADVVAAEEPVPPVKKAARKRATKKGDGVTSLVEEVDVVVPPAMAAAAPETADRGTAPAAPVKASRPRQNPAKDTPAPRAAGRQGAQRGAARKPGAKPSSAIVTPQAAPVVQAVPASAPAAASVKKATAKKAAASKAPLQGPRQGGPVEGGPGKGGCPEGSGTQGRSGRGSGEEGGCPEGSDIQAGSCCGSGEEGGRQEGRCADCRAGALGEEGRSAQGCAGQEDARQGRLLAAALPHGCAGDLPARPARLLRSPGCAWPPGT